MLLPQRWAERLHRDGCGAPVNAVAQRGSVSCAARRRCVPGEFDQQREPTYAAVQGRESVALLSSTLELVPFLCIAVLRVRLLSGSDYVGRGYHHRGAHLVSSRELSCCGGRWQNILAIGRPNMMQRSSGRPRRDGGWRCRQQLGSNDLGDCPFGGAFSLVFSLEFSLRRFDR